MNGTFLPWLITSTCIKVDFVVCFDVSWLVRLANSGFGHSGTPSPPLHSILSPSSPPFPYPRWRHPVNELRDLGSAVSSPPVGSGAKPLPTNDLVHIWAKKEQLWWKQFLYIFIRIYLNFCTNTRLLSSRYSVSLRAKHSVGSRGKAPGRG